MAFSLSKLFGSKNSTLSETTDTIEAIITDVENRPYGVSDNNVLFSGLNELGGYYFFQTMIIGQLNVKTKNGATLLFKGENFELLLDCDMPEFESGNTDVKGRNVTRIDFKIEESDIKLLENAKLSSMLIKVKKNDILFTKYVSSDEEE
jgi:hypothetical protein